MSTKKNPIRHVSFRLTAEEHAKALKSLTNEGYFEAASEAARRIFLTYTSGGYVTRAKENEMSKTIYQLREEVTNLSSSYADSQTVASMRQERIQRLDEKIAELQASHAVLVERIGMMRNDRDNAQREARQWRRSFGFLALGVCAAVIFTSIMSMNMRSEPPTTHPVWLFKPATEAPEIKPMEAVIEAYKEGGEWLRLDDGMPVGTEVKYYREKP